MATVLSRSVGLDGSHNGYIYYPGGAVLTYVAQILIWIRTWVWRIGIQLQTFANSGQGHGYGCGWLPITWNFILYRKISI